MRKVIQIWLLSLVVFASMTAQVEAQMLQINSTTPPTCTTPNSGDFEVELVGSTLDTVVFVLNAFPASGGTFTQSDTIASLTILYSGLSEGNYFVSVFEPGVNPDIDSDAVSLDITEPTITVPGTPVTLCSNEGPQDLLALVSADQPGGTFSFSGTGVTGNFYDPAGQSGFENVTVIYDLGVCSVNNNITFDIEPAPVLIIFPSTLCEDDSPIDLIASITTNIPGGTLTFVGSGVTGTSFDPAGLVGANNIDVTYTLNNCTVIDVLVITVQELPVLTLPPTMLCDNAGPQDLTTIVSVSPAGGAFTFSGPGVTGNSFDPTGLSGIQNINVTYDEGACTESGVLTIDVESAPTITLNPTTPMCENAGPQDLLTMVSGNPPGGTFSFAGPGVTGSNFDPSGLGGSSASIDVTYMLGSCSVTETMVIDVEATPVLILNPSSPLCENVALQDLLTMVSANPPGGAFTFSGPGVAGNSFDPSGLAGAVNIDVTYQLGTCTVMDVLVIDIQTTPVLTLNPSTPLCANAGLQNLLTMASASPSGGTFSFSGSGVAGNNFDPFGLSGPVNIDVTYVLGTCSVTETMVIEVEPTPVLTLNPTTPVCDADSPLNLLPMVSANPGGGVFSFSGPGVSGNQFDPMGQTGMVNITVTYQLGACTVNEVMIIDVEQAPSLSLSPTSPLCENAGPQDLTAWATANPGGGVFAFSGPGVTGTTFDPAGLNGFVNINVDYSIGACMISRIMQVDVQSVPTITFNPPAAICNDAGLLDLLTIVTVNPTGGTLTLSGPGVIGNNFNPSGLVGVIDIQVNYVLSTCSAVETLQLTLNDAATVTAGPDQTVCETDVVALNGIIGGGATSSIWTSTGSGLFDDNTSLTAAYTPSMMDRNIGSVILTLITNDPDGIGPCSVNSSSLTVTFNPAAIADAGPDQIVCERENINLNGAISGAAMNPIWVTLGGGTFDDPSSLTPTYFPDVSDNTAGQVRLVLTTDDPDGAGGCPASTDTVDITINALPQVNAGPDQAIPAGNMVSLDGTIGGSTTSVTWSSNGSGVFDDATSVDATYTPSAADILAGNVILILTTNDPDGAGPCIAQSDLMTVLIVTGNTLIAGLDQNICEGDTAFLSGVVACTAPNGITWTTTGSGTFDDSDALSTFYLPSANDIAADSILLILGVDDPVSTLGCLPLSDTLVLKVNPTPVADAGVNITICQGDVVQLNGSGGMSYLWSPAVALTDPTIQNPMASPMSTTTYTLTVMDNFGCADTASVTINVIATVPPVAPSPVDICQDFMAPRLTATGTNLNWYTDPALTNLVASGPEYQPGPAEFDVTIVGSTTFYVTQDVGCGESNASAVVVNVFDRNDGICSTLCPTVDFTAMVSDVVCKGDNTGIILLENIMGFGGSSPLLDILVNGNVISQTDQVQFSIPDLIAGDYQITVRQTGVCINLLTQTITVSEPPSFVQALVLDATVSLPDQATGQFTVEIEASSGTPPYEVSIDLVAPTFPPQSVSIDFTEATLNNGTGNYDIAFNSLFAGTYEITVRDVNGCIVVINQVVGYDDTIFIPNVFTPNGDRTNETFYIRNLPTNGTELLISNRWGKTVYESSDYQNDWDGEDHSDGTYFYRIIIEDQSYKGWVEIRRGTVP